MVYGPLTDAELAARNKSLTDEIGKEAEERFFRVMENPAASVHAWYGGIRRASRHEDKNGVDFFVLIKTKEGTDEIPIQIKSSRKWLLEFFRQHPKFHGEILIVAWYMTDDKIREVTFNKLKKRVAKRRSRLKQ